MSYEIKEYIHLLSFLGRKPAKEGETKGEVFNGGFRILSNNKILRESIFNANLKKEYGKGVEVIRIEGNIVLKNDRALKI